MKKSILLFFVVTGLSLGPSSSMALTDTYFATGEDLDYLIESDNTLAIQEIEYELRKFILFRKVEDYFFNLNDQYDIVDH